MLETTNGSSSGRDGKALKPYQIFFEDDFDPEYFDPDNVFFTAGSGNAPLPDDLPDRLMKKGNMMQKYDLIDETLTRHAIFKVMDNDIIPCSCGAYRKVIQNKEPDSLLTQCPKCSSQEPFNIADLTILVGGLLKLAIADGNNTELKPPNVTYDQICHMIEDIQNHEAWVKEMEGRTLRMQLKVLKGGISE